MELRQLDPAVKYWLALTSFAQFHQMVWLTSTLGSEEFLFHCLKTGTRN
jgi:hypothetical protein